MRALVPSKGTGNRAAEASGTFWGEGAVTERVRNAQFSIGCSECSAVHRDAGFQRDESLWAYPLVTFGTNHTFGCTPHLLVSFWVSLF